MSDKINLQEDFLGRLRRRRHPVTVFTASSFHLKGQITADEHKRQTLVFKSAVSAIVRSEG